jgi:hypothetical protein
MHNEGGCFKKDSYFRLIKWTGFDIQGMILVLNQNSIIQSTTWSYLINEKIKDRGN